MIRTYPSTAVAVFGAAAAAGIFALIAGLQLGGHHIVLSVDDVGQGVASLIGAAACAWAASRSIGRLRLAWALMSASAAVWTAGEVIFTWYEVALAVPVPFPSAADIGFTSAVGLSIAAVVVFWTSPGGTTDRTLAWLDAAIIGLSLLFTAWVLGLNQIYSGPGSVTDRSLAMAYPISDIAMATLLILVINRGAPELRRRMALLLAGVAASTFSYLAFSHLSSINQYGPAHRLTDTGWVAAYLLFAIAAVWPSRQARESGERAAAGLWQLSLPWMALLVAVASVFVLLLRGETLDRFLTLLTAALGGLLAVSQIRSHKESLSLLEASRRAATEIEQSAAKLGERTALLNDVINRAPIGIARIGVDLRVIDANPRLCGLLASPKNVLVGSRVLEFLLPDQLALAMDRFRSLLDRSVESIEGNSSVRRADGNPIQLHWTATVVPRSTGEIDYFLAMFEDVTVREGAEAKLRKRTALLNEVITHAPVAIARWGPDLKVIDVNPAFAALFNEASDSVVGSSVAKYVPAEARPQFSTGREALIRGTTQRWETETPMVRSDGSPMWVHWISTLVRDADGEIDYYLTMLQDVSAKHETEQAAAATTAALERLNQLKSEFMSMVSHEFRTALTGIQGYSEIMKTEPVTSDEVKEFSGDINADSLRLNRMITEMLDLDRIESGRITLHVAPLDLNQILQDAVERAQVGTSTHVIKADLDSALPLVDGDSDRLIQVVTNLLSNAIKYSPDGGDIVVTSRAGDGSVEVSVRDHGQGIPAEFLGKIFGRYERYEGDAKNRVVGTGLGLAIAQQIIQLHKGRIWVDSVLGAGSEFHFTLPVPVPVAVVTPLTQTGAVGVI